MNVHLKIIYFKMHLECLIFILISHTKTSLGRLLGETKEETTTTPNMRAQPVAFIRASEDMFQLLWIHCKAKDALDTFRHLKKLSVFALDTEEWCKFQPNSYDCGEKGRNAYLYYFDIQMKACQTAIIGDCDYNRNSFTTLKDCNQMCRGPGRKDQMKDVTPNIYCRMQPMFGSCNGYFPMWYFDVSKRTCSGFSYSGCGGNQNRFKNAQECTTVCVPSVDYKLWL